MKAGYGAQTGASVAVGTTRTAVIGVRANAAFGVDIRAAGMSFDGVSVTQVPVLVEFCYVTWATNPPGTNSTSVTPIQEYGRVLAHGVTAARTWTALPTVITVLDELFIHPQAGQKFFFPFASLYDCAFSEGFALCASAPAAVNCRASLDWERT